MNNFYGNHQKWFTGIVKEVIDESSVKVFIWGIHPLDQSLVDDSDLPIATVIYPTSGAQNGYGNISHNLDVDSWVIGFSPDDSFMQPIITGVVQGSDYSMSNYTSGGGEFVGDGQAFDGGIFDDGEVLNLIGASNPEKAYNYVYDKLLKEGSSDNPHLHTCALIGVLLLETPNINPKVVGGYKGRAWGICQWLGPRRTQLFKKYGKTKKLDQQLDFMWWELNQTEKRAKQRWLSAKTMPDAVAGFCAFERAEEWDLKRGVVIRTHSNFKKRLDYAYKAYNTFEYQGTDI